MELLFSACHLMMFYICTKFHKNTSKGFKIMKQILIFVKGQKNIFSICKVSQAHLQYAYNICTKFQIDCLKTLGGVEYANLLPMLKPNLKIV